MIKISVVSYNNDIFPTELFAEFGVEAKTLGRSEDNYFVLEDARHLVSRFQASVQSDGTHHTITNLSLANPLVLNGVEIEANLATALHPGDLMQIGLYLLRAELPGDAAAVAAQPAASPAAPASPASPASPAAPAALSTPPGSPLTAVIRETMPQAVTDDRPRSGAASALAAAADKAEASVQIQAPLQAQLLALMQALLTGAGLSSVKIGSELTPELMEMLGKLLAISVQGTMDLNALRSLVKREAKADVTMVVVRNNNPLKFLPDGPTVLTQMLRKKMPGFMSPPEAMADAYQDLHGHQQGVVAGTRAAMADALNRLKPEQLATTLPPPSLLDRLFPSRRKARLWDLHVRQHQTITKELQDDFRILFGPVFLSAYEQKIEQALDLHARQNAKGHTEAQAHEQ